VRLGGTDGVMVGSGVVAPTADATNSSARNFAGLGVFVVAKLVAPATLNEVGFVATVDVLDSSAIHAHPFPGRPGRQSITIINESEDNGACGTPDALGIDLKVGGDGHEGAFEHGVGAQFHCEVLPNNTIFVHSGDTPELCPGETPDGAELDKLAKQGADDVSIGEDQGGGEFARKREHEVALSDRPASTEDLRRFAACPGGQTRNTLS
jgi:hypothetical protein